MHSWHWIGIRAAMLAAACGPGSTTPSSGSSTGGGSSATTITTHGEVTASSDGTRSSGTTAATTATGCQETGPALDCDCLPNDGVRAHWTLQDVDGVLEGVHSTVSRCDVTSASEVEVELQCDSEDPAAGSGAVIISIDADPPLSNDLSPGEEVELRQVGGSTQFGFFALGLAGELILGGTRGQSVVPEIGQQPLDFFAPVELDWLETVCTNNGGDYAGGQVPIEAAEGRLGVLAGMREPFTIDSGVRYVMQLETAWIKIMGIGPNIPEIQFLLAREG